VLIIALLGLPTGDNKIKNNTSLGMTAFVEKSIGCG